MKYKLLATLMTLLMISVPALGFWHPPPPPDGRPPCTYMGTLINGNITYVFEEPVDGYCEDFHVTVYIANVTDMYGYDFVLQWNQNYFNLVSWTVATDIWAAQAIIFNGTIAVNKYQQVVTALPPSTGATGDFQLADLVFHIQNDVCPTVTASGTFSLPVTKVSNSCSGEIIVCNVVKAKWTFKPVMPKMWIDPPEEVNSGLTPPGNKFTVSVLLKDVVKMDDFTVQIAWNQYEHDSAYDCVPIYLKWSTLLTTTKADVILNTDLFNLSTATITVDSPMCGWYNDTNDIGTVYVHADTIGVPPMLLNLTYPSETTWLFNVTFTKCDPWYCGAQPEYTIDLDTHEFVLENATTPIYFYNYAYISGPCANDPGYIPTLANGKYTFAPVPGDLDGSGHVDIADLMILAAYYGLPVDCLAAHIPAGSPANAFTIYYDLNHDWHIDIYDIVIVAKNFCRTEP